MATPPAPISPSQIQDVLISNASLYVGDLHASVTESDLFDVFVQIGNVLSIRVCRDNVRGISLGYAYVNYSSQQEAARAMEVLNFTHIKGKPVRIMFSNRDPSVRKSGLANIFIKNLDPSIDNKSLHEIFTSFGVILSCKVATDRNGISKGHGFVQFEQEESAQAAIKKLNGMLINEKQVYVGLFVRRQGREQSTGSQKFTNVYVKNLSEKITDEELKLIFSQYGAVTSHLVMKDSNGKSKCFGFVNFQNPDDAARAIEKLNGFTKDDKAWYVGKAQTKAEREAELRLKYEEERNLRMEKLRGSNLYLKNLDENINDEKLRELFSDFGTIASCKVMLDSQGQSKGSGFIAFSTPEEANRAVTEMNGKMIGKKPLYVAIAQRKEERRAKLLARFAQVRAPGVVSPMPPSGFPGYAGAPRGAPQMYLGQSSAGMIPPQPAGFSFQQQLMPGIRAGVPPSFFMPYHLQRHALSAQRMGNNRRNGNLQHVQQQFFNRNGNHGPRYNAQNSRIGVDPSMALGLSGQMLPLPLDANGLPRGQMSASRLPSVSIETLSSALASASPEHQRLMLGEQLYPLVEQIERDNAGKVTGMLLEMDQTEVLHLLEAPEALKKKVAEALEVLQMSQTPGSDATDQLASLNLNG